jgi:hypothetical protein
MSDWFRIPLSTEWEKWFMNRIGLSYIPLSFVYELPTSLRLQLSEGAEIIASFNPSCFLLLTQNPQDYDFVSDISLMELAV